MKIVPRSAYANLIKKYNPVVDHEKIVSLLTKEFIFESSITFDIGFFKSFGTNRVSDLLVRTKQIETNSQKRYDDTSIILLEILLKGYSSEYGQKALHQMNSMHHRYPIPNIDYLFILSFYAFELIDWLELYGWRSFTDEERMAWFYFWSNLGQQMGISDIPSSESEYRHLIEQYEEKYVSYCENNEKLMKFYLNIILNRYMWIFRFPVRVGAACLLPSKYRKALGFKEPSALAKKMTHLFFCCRRRIQKMKPFIILKKMDLKFDSYPEGYEIEKVGVDFH